MSAWVTIERFWINHFTILFPTQERGEPEKAEDQRHRIALWINGP